MIVLLDTNALALQEVEGIKITTPRDRRPLRRA